MQRAAAWSARRPRSFGVPAAALLAHLARPAASAGEHAVEVVLLDAHRLGDLGDRDAGARAHELERLLGARAAAARAPAPAGAATRGAAARGAARARAGATARRALRLTGHALEGRLRGLQPVILVDQGLQLAQPAGDLPALLIQKVRHRPPPLGFSAPLHFALNHSTR